MLPGRECLRLWRGWTPTGNPVRAVVTSLENQYARLFYGSGDFINNRPAIPVAAVWNLKGRSISWEIRGGGVWPGTQVLSTCLTFIAILCLINIHFLDFSTTCEYVLTCPWYIGTLYVHIK